MSPQTFRNETALSKAVIARIRDRYQGHARKVHADGFTGRGEPDIDACVDGRAIKVELKMPGNFPTAAQYGAMRRWEAAGALVGWVTSLRELDELLLRIYEPHWKNPQLVEAGRRADPTVIEPVTAEEEEVAGIPDEQVVDQC